MKRSSLALIAAGVGGAAVAGYGLSIGRDAWKSTKKNFLLILFLAAVAGAMAVPFIGGRELVRGHDRGFFGTVFKTLVGSALLLASGFVMGFVAVWLFVAYGNDNNAEVKAIALTFAAGATAMSGCVGLLWGLFQRPGRLRKIAITRSNDDFLQTAGIRETGGDNITHYDASGQALRFLEVHTDRLVFMAVGRRGKRAYIDVGSDGRMTAYSGVVM
ncbi:hypothetical protein [Phyllobacterium bourgognense]|uniref:Uncharacterized protein n=1 Tax=Phyllobacterium bourgognense TaxID=314236 RepID=A0A368YE38_9HYPH|nr:hypothetical protein [Phyllobacterium bourgognense]RCW77698.1 hypothetical protein C7476_1395 [Phyllobacterium bourgognense]